MPLISQQRHVHVPMPRFLASPAAPPAGTEPRSNTDIERPRRRRHREERICAAAASATSASTERQHTSFYRHFSSFLPFMHAIFPNAGFEPRLDTFLRDIFRSQTAFHHTTVTTAFVRPRHATSYPRYVTVRQRRFCRQVQKYVCPGLVEAERWRRLQPEPFFARSEPAV